MVIWQKQRGRKKTGGKLRPVRGKRRYELGGFPVLTQVGEEKRKRVRTKGGGRKVKCEVAQWVNVSQHGKTTKVRILNVVKNPANPEFARKNILTKGALVRTELGLVRVTSRPGQEGVVNGVLVEE